MLTTLLALATILADLCIGAAAYRLSKSNEKNQTALNAILTNHETRITKLEVGGAE